MDLSSFVLDGRLRVGVRVKSCVLFKFNFE